MATELTWLGHGSWLIETGQHTLLLDPFLNDSPTAPVKADRLSPDYILVSHGHADHVSDCVEIARRANSAVISNFEICQWLERQGVAKTLPHNLGGGSNQPFGRVKLTLAHHSSALPDGANGGNPSGFLLMLPEGNVYFACDTGLFHDMKLIGACGVELAVVPIGDVFTMGPDDAIEAIKLIEPRRVAPSHYDTWPPIAQDAHSWADRVRRETTAEPCVIAPGDRIVL
jgi:L-ascorbate metabolism protein UlaG (beta-lactamase superfamily)